VTARLSLGILTAAGLFLLSGGGAEANAPMPCTAPPKVMELQAKLPNTARAIRHGKELTIVAIGSSSTEGIGASDTAHAYPAQLADELRQRWPKLKVNVINKGVGGEDTEDMLRRFSRDVLPHKPQLVIWQVGSNDALRYTDMYDFADVMRAGINRLKTKHTDIVLMDPQYAPLVVQKPLYRNVVDTIRSVANDFGVGVFQRFAVMRSWATSGETNVEDFISRDQLHMNDMSYGCIARLLADSLATAASTTPEDKAPAPLPLPKVPPHRAIAVALPDSSPSVHAEK
jgi:acyl-CoA thioesterase-1